MGQGNKTQYPWIAIMEQNITQSTQYGLYMVYLFKRDMKGFYLSHNKGITFFKEEYREKCYTTATLVVDYFRTQIKKTSFSKKLSRYNILC